MSNKRVVAIVGRPNVGKSAIFNRLAGRRISIVHEEWGVTRDRVSSQVTWNDQTFELIDTGGLGFIDQSSTRDVIAEETRKQVFAALEDAAVILFVVDIAAGIAPLDQEVARMLHQSGLKVFTVANKADNDELESHTPEFESLGFPVFSVAALHNRGFDLLMKAVLSKLPPAPEKNETEIRPLKVAIVGRPNAGKSSYINKLLKNDRVIVSDIPGTTRDSIKIPFTIGEGPSARHYLLIDTAGLRQLRRVDTAVERFSVMRTERSIEEADVVALVMDAEEGPSAQDKKIASKILENRKGCVLIINKWDMAKGVKDVDPEKYEEALRRVMPFLAFVPIVFMSAKSGLNVRKSIDMIDYISSQITTEISTATLNKVLGDAVQRVQPPLVKGKRMKLYYATQTGTRPVRFRLFVNDPTRLTDSYKLYLTNQLRKAFGFEGAPLVLDFKSSHSPASSK